MSQRARTSTRGRERCRRRVQRRFSRRSQPRANSRPAGKHARPPWRRHAAALHHSRTAATDGVSAIHAAGTAATKRGRPVSDATSAHAQSAPTFSMNHHDDPRTKKSYHGRPTNRRLAITCSDIAAGWQRAAEAILRRKVLGVLAYPHYFQPLILHIFPLLFSTTMSTSGAFELMSGGWDGRNPDGQLDDDRSDHTEHSLMMGAPKCGCV